MSTVAISQVKVILCGMCLALGSVGEKGREGGTELVNGYKMFFAFIWGIQVALINTIKSVTFSFSRTES